MYPKRAAGNPCDPKAISYAWIDPRGKVHKIPSGTWHSDWAEEFVEGVPSLAEKLWDEAGGDPLDLLLAEGWIKVSNATVIQVWDHHRPTQKAWDAAIDLIIQCALSDRRFDPERTFVVYETIRHADRIPVADFVARYGDRDAEEKLFEGLMQRLASRIASRWVGAASVSSTNFYHGTFLEDAEQIARSGFQLGRARGRGAILGAGVYMSARREWAENYANDVRNDQNRDAAVLTLRIKPGTKFLSVDPAHWPPEVMEAYKDEASDEPSRINEVDYYDLGYVARRMKYDAVGSLTGTVVVYNPKQIEVVALDPKPVK